MDKGLVLLFLFCVVPIVVVGAVPFALSSRLRARSARLCSFFGGVVALGSQELRFTYENVQFHLARIGRGSGPGLGGSYAVLWLYVEPMAKLIVGDEQAGRYALGQFLRLPPHELITVDDRRFLIGSEDTRWRSRAADIFQSDAEAGSALGELVQRAFDRLTVASEVHVSRAGFRKRCVLRMQVLPEAIYDDPALLEARLKRLLVLCAKLQIGLQGQRSTEAHRAAG